jgi:hypothetical protein
VRISAALKIIEDKSSSDTAKGKEQLFEFDSAFLEIEKRLDTLALEFDSYKEYFKYVDKYKKSVQREAIALAKRDGLDLNKEKPKVYFPE